MRMRIHQLIGLALFFLLLTGNAFAVSGRWSVTIMHPADGLYSKIYAIENGQKVGLVGVNTTSGSKNIAALWKGDTADWTRLEKNDIPSTAYAISAGQQAGYISSFGWVWDGGATEGNSLSLPGKSLTEGGIYIASIALGISQGWQAGEAIEQSSAATYKRAVLWRGTQDAPIVLHSGDAYSNSSVQGIYGAAANSPGYQVGYQEVYDGAAYWNSHATLWSGAANTAIDLNPSGAKDSVAYKGYGSQQVGYANINSSDQAILWNGAAANYVNLNPVGADTSYAKSVYGKYQVGYFHRTGEESYATRACLWEGSAKNYVDLHELLPAEYIFSQADDIEVRNGHIYVVGSAYNYQTGREEAIEWQMTPFGPMIWINGQSGQITVSPNQGLNVTAAFEAGSSTTPTAAVDWWLIVNDKVNNTYYYFSTGYKWLSAGSDIKACQPFYSGPVFTVAPTQIFSNVTMPSNQCTFGFGVSYPSTGMLEGGILWDQVDITVKQQ